MLWQTKLFFWLANLTSFTSHVEVTGGLTNSADDSYKTKWNY